MMTREELDRLKLLYREDFGTAEHGEFVVLMHENWHALITQARRAIELEERWAREMRLQRLETGRDEVKR